MHALQAPYDDLAYVGGTASPRNQAKFGGAYSYSRMVWSLQYAAATMRANHPTVPDLLTTMSRALLADGADMTLLVAEDGSVTVGSEGTLPRSVGHAIDDMLADPGRFVRPGDLARARELFGRVLAMPGASEAMTLWVVSADDQLVKVEVVASNRRQEIGRVVIRVRELEAPRPRDSMDSLSESTGGRVVSFHTFDRSLQKVVDRRLERFWSLPVFARNVAADRADNFAVVAVEIDREGMLRNAVGAKQARELVCGVVDEVARMLRGRDAIAYEGGSDLLLLLDGVADRDHVSRILDPTLALIPKRLEQVPIRTVVGITVSERRYERAAEVVRDARAAVTHVMRGSRRRGRQVFSTRIQEAMARQIALAEAFPAALRDGSIRPHFQPLYRVRDGRLVAVEALARWHHPSFGIVPPSDFLPIADELGMSRQLGRHMLRVSCLEAAAAMSEAPVDVAVNVTADDLADPELPAHVAAVLAESRLPARHLVLELTETVIVEDPEAVREGMTRLSELGVRFALDDFGTGYASLSHLLDLPFDRVKIDRSLVPEPNSTRATAVHGIAQLAHALGMRVVMEGIETEEQLRTIERLGCDVGQGYHLGRPTPTDEVPWDRARLANSDDPAGARVAVSPRAHGAASSRRDLAAARSQASHAAAPRTFDAKASS